MIDMDIKSKALKEAKTNGNVHELIRNRWSARAFADKPINQDDLDTLFEAASWAASSMNEQPWRYIYAHKGSPAYQKIYDCLVPGNQKWANRASVLIISLAKKSFSKNGKPNAHAKHDTGAANTTMFLQALSMDIYGHMMAGFDKEKTIEQFELPDDLEPVCFMAIGYLDDPETLEEPFRSRELKERDRRPVKETAFEGGLPG